MTENEQRPFSSVCDAVRSQADSMLMLADAMAREARKQASSLEQLSEWVIGGEPGAGSSRPGFERRINFWLQDTIAFLRDIGGRDTKEGGR